MISYLDQNPEGADGMIVPSPESLTPGITWDRKRLKRFKKALSQAVKEQMSKEGTFKFEGHDFLIAYACYLVEYLDQKLK